MSKDTIKKHFEQNMLDGDEVQQGQMMSSESVLEYLQEVVPEAEREATQPVYDERNRLVAVLSKVYPSHFSAHDPKDTEWEDDWRNIVCIHTPKGQASWHIHDDDVKYFLHLPKQEKNHWDGHTTEEKYDRLATLTKEEKS